MFRDLRCRHTAGDLGRIEFVQKLNCRICCISVIAEVSRRSTVRKLYHFKNTKDLTTATDPRQSTAQSTRNASQGATLKHSSSCLKTETETHTHEGATGGSNTKLQRGQAFSRGVFALPLPNLLRSTRWVCKRSWMQGLRFVHGFGGNAHVGYLRPATVQA